MADTDFTEVLRENWTGICRQCEWKHTDIGSQRMIVEARVHLNAEGDSHVVDVYRDGELMTVIESVVGSESEYLGQNTPSLAERKKEREAIAREVADSERT